ncbi:hypothetical protein V3Q90_15405 [Flavobacterium oreochromis]|uniref:hypothetical protein n=1 Tax=Flavobacterium oreochromis TaxID=2906078 RepID=UPI00385E96C9
MKYLKNIILLFFFLNSFYGFAQCETIKSLFENDLYASKELRDYASKADDPDKVFDAWHLLLEEKSLEKTNAKVLKEVEDNYQAIKNAGGYSKWKNLPGAEKLVDALTETTIKHINKGEIKYVFKDARFPNGKKEFTFTTDNVWTELERDFNNKGEFTQLLFDNTYNKPTIDFIGMHNYDNFISFTQSNSPTGKLFKNSGTDIIGEVAGKKAYVIKEPEIWIPDLDNLVSKNKYKQLQNRIWEGTGKWQLKKSGPTGRVSSCFIEGMTEVEINKMISDAYKSSNIKWDGTQWESIIVYKSKNITLRGYKDESGNISSVFIKEIN